MAAPIGFLNVRGFDHKMNVARRDRLIFAHRLDNYTLGHKNGATIIFTITLANVDRFQQFFQFWIRR